MKKSASILMIACSGALFSACGGEDNDTEQATDQPSLVSIELSYMDTTVSPREDFYQFANGTWVKENPVPSTDASWGSFNELQNRNTKLLREILEEAANGEQASGSVNQLIGDYYYALMDSTTRDAAGIAPLQAELDRIANLASKDELGAQLAHMHLYGITPFFNLGVEQDLGDNTKTITYIGQGGMSLPSKDFYTAPDYEDIRVKFIDHVTKMFILAGHDEAAATAAAGTIMQIESQLASGAMGPVELRSIQTQYNKRGVDQFKGMVPSVNWDNYLSSMDLPALDSVVVTQLNFFPVLESSIANLSLDDIKTYLTWHLLDNTANALSSDFENQNFEFFGKALRGRQAMKVRWKRALSSMQGSALGEAVGHAFVDRAFTEDDKARVNEMVDNLMAAFEERLDQVDWMTDSTKLKAKEKLANFTRKLGYPDKWTDYSKLAITRDNYLQNYLNQRKFSVRKGLDKLGKPIDKAEWGMPPHMINAYYNPLFNEIVFPAGIMQPPFFDPNAEDAINYGRMGMIIGHEFSHGFDDQGCQFDANGLFSNWWTPQDAEEFASRTSKLVEQFNAFEALPDLFVNGELTLGENIADLAGLTLSYYAYQKSLEGKEKKEINGYTPEQRFFIGFAQIWKINYTDEAMKQQVNTNVHAPGMFRVLGPLANMPEFFEAFDVQEGDPMRQPADKIVSIW